MKKSIILGIIILIVIVILIMPNKKMLNDGGTVEYVSYLYKITKYHQLLPEDTEKYKEGLEVQIFGITVYNDVAETIECKDEEQKEPIKEENNENKSFVGTILDETTKYMIVKPNEDEEEIKVSDRFIINYKEDLIDYLYGVGKKVVINYSGDIMETYPAQIKTNYILIDGYEDFKLTVKKSKSKKAVKILSNTELYKYNSEYDLYYYGLDEVNIEIEGKTMPLEEALRSGKMTIDGLIQRANKDFPDAKVLNDGGSMEYFYDDYTIIKVHKYNGNRDVYIGVKNTKINQLNIKN